LVVDADVLQVVAVELVLVHAVLSFAGDVRGPWWSPQAPPAGAGGDGHPRGSGRHQGLDLGCGEPVPPPQQVPDLVDVPLIPVQTPPPRPVQLGLGVKRLPWQSAQRLGAVVLTGGQGTGHRAGLSGAGHRSAVDEIGQSTDHAALLFAGVVIETVESFRSTRTRVRRRPATGTGTVCSRNSRSESSCLARATAPSGAGHHRLHSQDM